MNRDLCSVGRPTSGINIYIIHMLILGKKTSYPQYRGIGSSEPDLWNNKSGDGSCPWQVYRCYLIITWLEMTTTDWQVSGFQVKVGILLKPKFKILPYVQAETRTCMGRKKGLYYVLCIMYFFFLYSSMVAVFPLSYISRMSFIF